MTLIHKYISRELVRNFILASLIFTMLFLVVDFFDRIDNILKTDAGFLITIKYFAYKIPVIFTVILPIAALVSVLMTVGMLAKGSEIIAMRAGGMKLSWLIRPIIAWGLILSFVSLLVNELLIPYCNRRVKEIYNLDIQEKDKTGTYSQNDFWWRSGNQFYSVNMFDSRSNTLHKITNFVVNPEFDAIRRTDSNQASFIAKDLGWRSEGVKLYRFHNLEIPVMKRLKSQSLAISKNPEDFYSARMDPLTMSYFELKAFISEQTANGLSTAGYLADLYAKTSFPLVVLLVSLLVIPFALKPARSGSMAISAISGIAICFSYYVIHSISLALGRAEIFPAFLAAWTANIIMGIAAILMLISSETPE